MNKGINIIKSLALYPLQGYLTDKIQLFDIVEEILQQTGKADMLVTSFSISEEFIRKIFLFKEKELLQSIKLIIDHRAAGKITKLLPFACNVFDEIYLGSNHSKVLLFSSATHLVSLCTSQNQTRGNRMESGMISTDKGIYDAYHEEISIMIKNSIQVNGCLARAL